MAHQDALVHGLPLTRESFQEPPLEMGIVPFWFWNGEMDPAEMEWQLREYYDKGVRSLFIHGRMALEIGYLSDEWFECVKFAVAKGKEIGLDLWVYDEMDWPSGTAERQVIEAYPHTAQKYLDLVALHIEGPLFTFLEAQDSRYVNTGPAKAVAAYGVRTEQFESTIEEVTDLNKHLSFENTVPWEAPAGKWTLMYFLEKEAPWYIDTLDPESTERFIELTHEKYRAAVGDEFGRAVPGFYTDEPAMYYFQVGLQNHVVPWSRQMFKIFRERRGYDLKPFLPALYTRMGEVTAQVRFDFYQTLTEQYEETYYKRIADWCHEHGTLFTGHLLFEELLRLQARCEGNLFRYLRHMDVVGVDHLYPKVGSKSEPAEHVALKIGSSAAHHFGSARLLCESMGGTYWDCTLERMKWIANWELVLGVNLFNNHGYHYTIEGERKRDWPPSQFYHHTWWGHYPQFTDYMARLGHLLSGGRHVAKVAVLYPITSIWAHFVPQHRDAASAVIEDDFTHLTDALLRMHLDFDYLDEEVLADATVEDGTITIRDETFEVLVLPATTHLRPETVAQVERLVEGGGHVIATTLVPQQVLRPGTAAPVPPNGHAPDLDGLFGVDGAALRQRFEDGQADLEVHTRDVGAGTVSVIAGPGLRGDDGVIRDQAFDAVRNTLLGCITPDVTVSDEAVFYLHRVKDGHHVYFLANTTQQDRGRVEVSVEHVGRPELWDPNTGETRPLDVYEVRDGRLVVALDFPPSEARVVIVPEGSDASGAHVTDTNLDGVAMEDGAVVGFLTEGAPFAVVGGQRRTADAKAPVAPVGLPTEFDFHTEEPNALLVGDWRMHWAEADADRVQGFERPDLDDAGWLAVTNGSWEMQLPQERDEAVYPVTVQYRTRFTVRDVPDDARLLIDGFRGDDVRLWLNGTPVPTRGERSWLDAQIPEVDVQSLLVEGENVVAVELAARKRTDGVLDLLKLVGDFGLEGSEADGWAVVAPRRRVEVGDWTEQGYPFFSGTGVYRCTVEVPADVLDGRVTLEADCGEDVLEVRVNGGPARVAPWHPYRLDVTDDVVAGTNTVEVRVTNTLINILEGKPHASGLMSPPRLTHAHRYRLD
ncbi:glycosyl hydrolase [Rubrivirga sp.]|uniref:glycosyl hydrolase n=1 Tax=Rubrivirga sp. TaxID=1885344 RepID=UPI003B51B04A